MSDLWNAASIDYEKESRDALISNARVACAEHFVFASSASSSEEFQDRLALVAPQIEKKVLASTISDASMFPVVHAAVLESLEEDFSILLADREASMKKGAPFAGYSDFDECVRKNADKDDPKAYCGSIKNKVEKKSSRKWASLPKLAENAPDHFGPHPNSQAGDAISQLDDVDVESAPENSNEGWVNEDAKAEQRKDAGRKTAAPFADLVRIFETDSGETVDVYSNGIKYCNGCRTKFMDYTDDEVKSHICGDNYGTASWERLDDDGLAPAWERMASRKTAERNWVGDKYVSGRDVKDIAKDIRSEIKSLIAQGKIPGAPVKYSVKIDRYSMGQSIDINIMNWDEYSHVYEVDKSGFSGREYSQEAGKVKEILNSILESHLFDNSDIMTDYWNVNFYGFVNFDSWTSGSEVVVIDENGQKVASRKTSSVYLTNVGFVGGIGSNTARGYDKNGDEIVFRLSDSDAEKLSGVLLSDQAMNFSGVEIDEEDIISIRKASSRRVREGESFGPEGRYSVERIDGDQAYVYDHLNRSYFWRAVDQIDPDWGAETSSWYGGRGASRRKVAKRILLPHNQPPVLPHHLAVSENPFVKKDEEDEEEDEKESDTEEEVADTAEEKTEDKVDSESDAGAESEPVAEEVVAEEQEPAPVAEEVDPQNMTAGERVTVNYTMSGGNAGSVDAMFIREDKNVFYFNGPTGEFGVANTGSGWQDADGNSFSFSSQDGVSEDQSFEMKPKETDSVESEEKTAGKKTAMPSPAEMGVEVGDIFVSSWGYDQTNVDFYQVTRLTAQSVEVRAIASELVSGDGWSGTVVAVPNAFLEGLQAQKFVSRLRHGYQGEPSIKVGYQRYAWLWDGKPKTMTSYA